MIDTKKLCETIGLDEEAFKIRFVQDDGGFTYYVVSESLTGRQVEPEVIGDENKLLYETEQMFEYLIFQLKEELAQIKRHRATYFGPEKKDGTKSKGTKSNKKTPGSSKDRGKKKE